MALHQVRRSRQLAIRLVYWQRWVTACFKHNTYVHILYLRQDAICAILRTGSITIAGKWLNCLIFHDNIKLQLANRLIIYIGTKYIYMSHDDHSFHTKILGSTKSF